MVDRSSRHTELATYKRRLSGSDQEVDLYQPRLRETPEITHYHRVVSSDRLDLIAYQYIGDPHQFWKVADANPETALEQLLETGRLLAL